jgi:hypothetical protein
MVTPSSTAVYHVTGSNASGCIGGGGFTVTVNTLPQLSIAGGNRVICAGSTLPVQLSVSGAASYVWNPGLLAGSSVTVLPLATTAYTCLGTDANGCSNTAITTVSVSICEGLEKSVSLNGTAYNLFPNPSQGRLVIRAGHAAVGDAVLELSDATGRLVYSQSLVFENGGSTADISSLPRGVYFARLYSKNSSSQKTILIKE